MRRGFKESTNDSNGMLYGVGVVSLPYSLGAGNSPEQGFYTFKEYLLCTSSGLCGRVD
ncbi:MAG: hypothetical protein IID03_12660 [Candidatus Dadabacteria bacterium]|nr:hypothetical protein [Candidatus Dadabacteria bacterium]